MAERPEDLNLPNSVVTRIIKEALPDGVNVSKDARLAISKAASVFVLYATSCANTFAVQHKRKTISANDVLDAVKEMEFDTFLEPLKTSLVAYKKEQQEKKEASERRKKAREEGVIPEGATEEVGDNDSEAAEDNGKDEGED